MRPLVYALPGNAAFTGGLCANWPADVGHLSLHRFPDGESLVRLDTPPQGRDVALVCTLHDPDPKIMPLLFAAGAAREQGARSVGLVAPYMAYLRQDLSFHAGEARSAGTFARILSGHFDWIVTVDPHLHRIHSLDEVFTTPAVVVQAAPLLASWIATQVREPLLIGPDEESGQWVRAVAEAAHAPWHALRKVRTGDREVEIGVPSHEHWTHRTPVIVDDIISSGATMNYLVRKLRGQGLAAPVCVAVHAVFAPSAYAALQEAGAGRVVTANTIEHESNAIDVTAAVAAAARPLVGRRWPARGAVA
jgi:ribose-phosphate pyrophosphokinase